LFQFWQFNVRLTRPCQSKERNKVQCIDKSPSRQRLSDEGPTGSKPVRPDIF
jgi:hypothetical protein